MKIPIVQNRYLKTNFKISEKFVPLFILLLCAINYGSTLNLGYFWDDWFNLWNYHALGAAGVYQAYAIDRPIHGYLLGQFMQVLGETPALWHLMVVLVLAANASLCWLVLRQLWTDRPVENALIAAFIAVYPGFSQQSMALIYILMVFGGMCLWALSIWLMLLACRNKRFQFLFVSLACILAISHLAITEYFIGLEFLRPVLLAVFLAQSTSFNFKSDWRKWLEDIFFTWLPYLAALLLYLFFRLVLFRSGRKATDTGSIFQKLQTTPLAELSNRAAAILADTLKVTLLAWQKPLYTFVSDYLLSPRFWWYCIWISVAVGLVSLVFFHFLKRPESDPDSKPWAKQVFWLGLAGVLLAGLPIWGIGREVSLVYFEDRYSFPFVFGSALLLVVLIYWIAKKPLARLALAAAFIGLAAGFHLWNYLTIYQPDWANQENFLSQLSWRAPGLQPGTSVWVATDPPLFKLDSDYGLAMPVNLLYGPDQHTENVSYWVFPFTYDTFAGAGIFWSGAGPTIQRTYRNVTFSGNPRQTVVVWFSPQDCLKVIDPGQPEMSEVYPIATIGRELAHIDPIITTPGQAQFPASLFGVPTQGWCYYFEKADLARQVGDWQTAARLGDEAIQKGLKPANVAEWMPFIEAYVRIGRLDDAASLIPQVESSPRDPSRLMICGFVARVSPGANTPTQKFLAGIGQQASCAAP